MDHGTRAPSVRPVSADTHLSRVRTTFVIVELFRFLIVQWFEAYAT